MRHVSHSLSLLLVTALWCVSFEARVAFAAPPEILYLLDASGSMNEKSGGESRLDSAKNALRNSLKQLPEGTPLGFRVFAHRVAQQDKEGSCKDTELIAPISPERTGAVGRALGTLKAKGYTPLAYAIQQAGNDFATTREANRVIILLSDGEETCGGDPAAELRKIKEKGIDVKFYAIGFNVDARSRAQLTELASIGGGEYFDAQNARELSVALSEATRKSLIIEKKKSIYGEEIRGGDSFESAKSIEFNKEYRLDHHQMANFYDYFSFDLAKGQEVTISLKTLENGLSVDAKGKVSETDDPQCRYTLSGPDRTSFTSGYASHKYRKEEKKLNAGVDGKHYLLVGGDTPQNRDGCTFTITYAPKGDLGTTQDAGEVPSLAITIQPQKYPVNYLGGNDEKDVFKFDASKGDEIAVGLIPGDGVEEYFYVRVFNTYKQELFNQGSQSSGAGFKTKSFTIPDSDTYYLEIKGGGSSLKEYAFELLLTQTAKALPVTEGSAAEP